MLGKGRGFIPAVEDGDDEDNEVGGSNDIDDGNDEEDDNADDGAADDAGDSDKDYGNDIGVATATYLGVLIFSS